MWRIYNSPCVCVCLQLLIVFWEWADFPRVFFGRNVFLLKTCAHLRVLSFCVSMIAILMRKLGCSMWMWLVKIMQFLCMTSIVDLVMRTWLVGYSISYSRDMLIQNVCWKFAAKRLCSAIVCLSFTECYGNCLLYE